MSGLRRLTFTRSSSAISTAFRVTSAPVPAVVGMAMNGAERSVSGCAVADDLEIVVNWRVVREQRGDRLPRVDHAAAAERDDEVAPRARARCARPAPPARPWARARRGASSSGMPLLAQRLHERLGALAALRRGARARRARREAPALAEASFAEEDSRRAWRTRSSRAPAPTPPRSGKSAWYFTLRRGSAIMCSTLSRHVG